MSGSYSCRTSSGDSLEIEEEFDLSLLGIGILESEEKDQPVKIEHESPTSPLPARPRMARSASSMLRAITGMYESADWAPEPLNPRDLVGKDKLNMEKRELSGREAGSEEVVVVRDFAGGVEEQPATMGIAGEEMENTESYLSTVPSVHDRLRPRIAFVRARLPGRRRYRTKIRVHRTITPPATTPSIIEDHTSVISEPIRAEPPSPFQRDFACVFGRDVLDKVEHQSKLDSSSGNRLPPVIRDLFTALAEPATAMRIANVIRRQLELPQLNLKNDKIALKRAVALMRDTLYVEMVSALTLPLAPPPEHIDTDTDDEPIKRPAMSLTPTNLFTLSTKIPRAFPAEKSLIKAFLADNYSQAYGEKRGQVVWQGGVGKLRGKGENGFRGKYDMDGLCHVFVDHSNILYGLLHHLAAHPSDALPPRHLRTMSLPSLSLLLRRGRPTPPGSLHLVASSPLHQNLDPLVRLGWEVSVMKRVELFEDEVEDPTSMHTTPKLQARITGTEGVGLRRYKEQAVDEILQLGILTTLNAKGLTADKGCTLVLATGDARGGQFNREGFIGAVREALKRGWNVELWSFKSGLSRAWIEMARKERWNEGGRFTIWALDDWAEQLVEVAEEEE